MLDSALCFSDSVLDSWLLTDASSPCNRPQGAWWSVNIRKTGILEGFCKELGKFDALTKLKAVTGSAVALLIWGEAAVQYLQKTSW